MGEHVQTPEADLSVGGKTDEIVRILRTDDIYAVDRMLDSEENKNDANTITTRIARDIIQTIINIIVNQAYGIYNYGYGKL